MKKLFIFLFSLGAFVSAQEPMLDALNEGIFLNYNPDEQILLHQGTSFHLITSTSGHLSEAPVVSIGMIPLSREIILLDPDSAPYLEEKYKEISTRIVEKAGRLEEVFMQAANFVKHELFLPPLCSEEALDDFLHDWIFSNERDYEEEFTLTRDQKRLPVIPLEEFAKAKCGVCRHQAFVMGYFLDKMQKDERLKSIFPSGKTFLVREEVMVYKNPTHHAWDLFVSDGGAQAWHIDATFGIIKNLQTEQASLVRIYGRKAIDHEKDLIN